MLIKCLEFCPFLSFGESIGIVIIKVDKTNVIKGTETEK